MLLKARTTAPSGQGSLASPRFAVGETPYFGMAGSGTFSEEVTLPAASVVKMPDDVPFEIGALMGCGVMTGIGSVINVARVRPGETVTFSSSD